jgi:endonuclease-3
MEKRIDDIIRRLKKEIEVDWSLSEGDPFQVLIRTVLSQRTRDENTDRAAKRLFSRYGTPEEIVKARVEEIEGLIRPSGFYRVKSRKVKEISREIMERFGGRVPDDIEDLVSLPGVGRKTANCVLVYAYRVPALPVDTHLHRIPNRIGLIKTRNPEESERELMKIVPRKHWIVINELFVKFGQRICKPIKPECYRCPIVDLCRFERKNLNPGKG